MKHWKIPLLFFILFTFCGCRLEVSPGPEMKSSTENISKSTVIEINSDDITGSVNPLVFGTNMIGYDPSTYEFRDEPYYGYSNFGSGVWDPSARAVDSGAAAHAKEAGVSIARFPGGCGTHRYNWKHTIGPVEDRSNFQYGLDEFMQTCETIGSRAVITLSYYVGSSQDAADLVEYLNSPDDGSNPGGGVEWANIRAANGHPEPYNVTYFEFGNEEFHGNHSDIKKVSGAEYGLKFIKYSQAMKAIDPDIKLGAVTVNPDQVYYGDWNLKVIEAAGQHIDFFIEHTYDAGEKYQLKNKRAKAEQIDSIYRNALDGLAHVETYYRQLSNGFGKIAGKKNIPIAVTEYNGNFIRDSPYPYRHALGTALFNAGLIQIFMRPENNILMANYWQFYNSYWGMVKNESLINGTDSYTTKRPIFYVLKLFKEHFGKKLLSYRSTSEDLLVSASLSEDSKKIYLMVINKNMKNNVNARLTVKKTNLSEDAHIWILNGPAVDSINETVENVKIESSMLQLTNDGLDISFQPHSLAFIELIRN